MTGHILRALGLSLVGMMVGETIVWFAATTWDSISAWWMIVALAFSLWGFVQTYLTAGDQVPRRRAFRAVLMVLCAVTGGLTNYLSWVIASRTWSADVLPPEHQGFFFQLLNPWVLPSLVDGSDSSMPLETGWIQYLLFGVVAGGGLFWYLTRPPKAAATPATS